MLNAKFLLRQYKLIILIVVSGLTAAVLEGFGISLIFPLMQGNRAVGSEDVPKILQGLVFLFRYSFR